MNNPDEEREANLFAMELLMPEQFVRDEVAKLKAKDFQAFIPVLANKFKVDPAIMAIRVAQLLKIP